MHRQSDERTGEAANCALRPDFARRLTVRFRGSLQKSKSALAHARTSPCDGVLARRRCPRRRHKSERPMNKRFAVTLLLTMLPAVAAAGGAPPIPLTAASRVFTRAHALCSADGGRLWGVSLCGPLMLANPQTHAAIANAPVPGAVRTGAYYRFTLPVDVPIADAPLEYGGTRWAQVMWPLSGSADLQAVTLMHESFHRIQPKLGFVVTSAANSVMISGDAALDTQAGRIWLRAEIHALHVALTSSGGARTRALADALALRAYRHALLPSTVAPEHELDIMEGLAESTGIDVGLPPARRIAYTLHDMMFAENAASYARSFCYAIGPAYSELLDAVQPNWRRKVTPATSIAALAARAYGISVATPSAARAQAIIARYGGAAIQREEAARAEQVAQRNAQYRAEFVTGSTLRLPMTKFKIDFRPSDIERFENYGSVYRHVMVIAPWGRIVVTGGDAMIDGDFSQLTVSAPPSLSGLTVHGAGWVLKLAAGSKIVADPKKLGSYTVVP